MTLGTMDANTQFQYRGGSMATKELPHVDSSNVVLLVNITVLNNAVPEGAGKCIFVSFFVSSFRLLECN